MTVSHFVCGSTSLTGPISLSFCSADKPEPRLCSPPAVFAPMGDDFSAMNIRPVGGLVQEIANRKVLVVVYRGSGSTIICYTFLGFESDAPEIAELFFDPGHEMIFYQFHYARTNAVMHREGSLTCVLMSQMPMDGLLRLARAKAFSS